MEIIQEYKTHIAQHEREIAEFVELIQQEGITSYLEIGARYGGSLWRIGTSLPVGSRLVAIDLPQGEGTKFPKSLPHLQACVEALTDLGYDAHLILGDSTDPAIIEAARKLGPYDLCFIDALHIEKNVRSDWRHYGPMGRIVAFHDIAYEVLPHKPVKKFPIEVPKVWNEIKKDYRHIEIKYDRTFNGIGVLWR